MPLSTYPYLLKDYDIGYAYSATLYFRENQQQQRDSKNDGYISFAPSYEGSTEESITLRSSLGRFRDAFVPLSWNQEEASYLGKYLKGNSLIGEVATERAFKEQASNAKILHLAMHAFVDDEEPMNSKLAFYQDQDSIEDGFLHTFELFNMDLNADLAVLSACETGYGKLVKGEGIMSLARGFSYAGIPSVVMSHWQVDDQSTNQLMRYFYQYLSEGNNKSRSLKQAKLKYIKEALPGKKHPFFWGAFVVIGDDSPIASKEWSWYWILGVIIIIVFGTGIYWRKE